MKKYICPHCQKETIGFKQRFLGIAFSTNKKCSSCGGLSTISYKSNFISYLPFSISLICSIYFNVSLLVAVLSMLLGIAMAIYIQHKFIRLTKKE